jgi:hypothetical protein
MIIGGGSFLVFEMIRLVSFLLFSLLHTTLPHVCYTKEALLLFLTLFVSSEVVSSHQHELLSITYCRQGYHC